MKYVALVAFIDETKNLSAKSQSHYLANMGHEVPEIKITMLRHWFYIFAKLINKRKNLRGKILVPIFFRVSKTIFSRKCEKLPFFGEKTAIFNPKKKIWNRTPPPPPKKNNFSG
jgi:hypothetical protein